MVESESVPNWSCVFSVRLVCLVDWVNEYATRWVVASLIGEPFLLAGAQSARARSDVAVTSSKSSTRCTVGLVVNALAWIL